MFRHAPARQGWRRRRALANASRIAGRRRRVRGIGEGDRVCSLLHNRIEALVVFFGVKRIGAVWAPVNAGLMGQDLAHVLRDADPALIVVEGSLAARLRKAAPGAIAARACFNVDAEVAGDGHETFGDLLRAELSPQASAGDPPW